MQQAVTFSRHGLARSEQRGIRREVVDVLLAYGLRKRRRGAAVCFMDASAREAARDDMGAKAFARIENKLKVYLVLADDGTIITCAHLLKRIMN